MSVLLFLKGLAAAGFGWHAAHHAAMGLRTINESDTASLNDDSGLTTYNSSDDGTITIPNDQTAGWSKQHTLVLYQSGVGSASFLAGAGVTLRNSGLRTYQYGFLIARRVAVNEWVVA